MDVSDQVVAPAALCLAQGCDEVLAAHGKYSVQRRLCPAHLKADCLKRKHHGDLLWRFCQQCGKLEPLTCFDGAKRSCRVQLARRRQGYARSTAGPADTATVAEAAVTAARSCPLRLVEPAELEQQKQALEQQVALLEQQLALLQQHAQAELAALRAQLQPPAQPAPAAGWSAPLAPAAAAAWPGRGFGAGFALLDGAAAERLLMETDHAAGPASMSCIDDLVTCVMAEQSGEALSASSNVVLSAPAAMMWPGAPPPQHRGPPPGQASGSALAACLMRGAPMDAEDECFEDVLEIALLEAGAQAQHLLRATSAAGPHSSPLGPAPAWHAEQGVWHSGAEAAAVPCHLEHYPSALLPAAPRCP